MTAINDSGKYDVSVCFQKEVCSVCVDSSSPQCNISVQIWVSLQQFSRCCVLVGYRAVDTDFDWTEVTILVKVQMMIVWVMTQCSL